MWAEIATGGLVAGSLLAALSQRRRVGALNPLVPDEADASQVRFVTAPGVVLDETTKRRAAGHLATHALDVLDLVPGKAPTRLWMEWLEAADPALQRDVYARRVSAGHAVAMSEAVATKLGDLPTTSDPPGLLRLYARLGQQAPSTTGAALVEELVSTADAPAERAALLRLRFGLSLAPYVVLRTVSLLLLVGAVVGSPWGLVALGAWQLRPALGLAGTHAQATDLALACLLRPIFSPLGLWRDLWAVDEIQAGWVDRLRGEYRTLLDQGIADERKPRGTTCPVCGGGRLEHHLRTSDLLQHKPGSFTLERCEDCRHLFQNPPLSEGALAFFYRDFYDGLGEAQAEEGFLSTGRLYPQRANAVEGLCEPRRWLDVGAGHAHLALELRRRWPGLVVEGIDLGDAVVDAQARGWLDRGWKGTLDEHATALEGRFDVASLFHCLEHVPDQAGELRAVARVVRPGGLVIVEVPNPDFRFAAWMGRYWFPWFQPQHQHLLNLHGLKRLATDAGLEIVRHEHLSTAGDFLLATALFVGRVTPGADVPWKAAPTRLARAMAVVPGVVALPAFVLAVLADALVSRLPAGARHSNAFRVIARKPAQAHAPRYASP